jgi:hypothetical protein
LNWRKCKKRDGFSFLKLTVDSSSLKHCEWEGYLP